MTKVDCGDGSALCRCDPVTGCGHLSSWHYVTERWSAKCRVPGCQCHGMDVCNCVESGTADLDSAVLTALGIAR